MDKLCKYLDRELEEMENKVANGGKLSRTEIEDGKNLAKFKMALLTNEAMKNEGYSNDGRMYYEPYMKSYDGSYPDRNGMSNARGRGSNAKRDSMGRYSSEEGYSRAEHEFRERLEDAIESAPDEHKRKKLERMLNEM